MTLLSFSSVVAIDSLRCIGKNGAMPWQLPSDLRRFRSLTVGKICLMGRKTYESLPRPLPHRHHLVVSESWSKNPHLIPPSLEGQGEVVETLGEAVWGRAKELVQGGWHPEVMVAGGGAIYQQTLPVVNRVYLTTLVERAIEGGDTFFPLLPPEDWEILHLENHPDKTYGVTKFAIYQRVGLHVQK